MTRSRWTLRSISILAALLLEVTGLHAQEVSMPVAPATAEAAWPPPGGNFPVGVRTFSWTDSTRSSSGRPDDEGFRTVTATAWYPAAVTATRRFASYAPGIEKVLNAIDTVPENRRPFIMAHQPLQNVVTHAVVQAPPVGESRAWPLILFSPGGNVSRHFQTALAERLASQGFVFVAVSHPFSSLDFDAEFTMSLEWDLDNEDRQIADANDNLLADILAKDAYFAFSQLRGMDDDALARTVDFNRAGIAGHSRGGKTVGRACSTYDEFKACVVLDNIGPARERVSGIEQPFMTLRAPWDEDRVSELHDYLGRTGSVAFDVELRDANHFSCSDLSIFVPQLRAESWEPVDGIDACAGIIGAFLNTYIAAETTEPDWFPANSSDRVQVNSFGAQR